jgi:hypothetical protein
MQAAGDARGHALSRGAVRRALGSAAAALLRAVSQPRAVEEAALAAVARKLLIAINAMMRDQRPWQPAVVAEPSCC